MSIKKWFVVMALALLGGCAMEVGEANLSPALEEHVQTGACPSDAVPFQAVIPRGCTGCHDVGMIPAEDQRKRVNENSNPCTGCDTTSCSNCHTADAPTGVIIGKP